jgi:hypothetical protein
VNYVATETPTKRLVIRWTTFKGLAAIIIFLAIAGLIEYIIVSYAMNIGVKETIALQWTNQFLTITISPLFHLVPIAVIITLLFIWIYLTRNTAIRPYTPVKGKTGITTKRRKESGVKRFVGKVKAGLMRVKGIAYLWQRIHFARTTIRSALMVLLVFGAFILVVSLIAFPRLIPQTVGGLYQNNQGFLNSIKGLAQTLAPIGSIFSGINSALLAGASGFRSLVISLGNFFRPLTSLDDAGKYLVFQNASAWIAALAVLFYAEYRKSYRYKKSKG